MHRADQAGRAELNTSRYFAEAPITPATARAAAASPALAALRLAASACGSCHTVSLIKGPEAQSAYSSAAQKPLVSASKGTAVSPYQATAFSTLDSFDDSALMGATASSALDGSTLTTVTRTP